MNILYKDTIQYYLSAKTVYNIHSPFVYDFVTHVMDTSRFYHAFSVIEAARKHYLRSKEMLNYVDFGMGKSTPKRVSKVARTSLSSVLQCRMLFNLVHHYKPDTILELGTSLGISSMYLAASSSTAQLYTLEGNPDTVTVAKNTFKQCGYKNIEVIEGDFRHTLDSTLTRMDRVDVAFLDGNHAYEPTIEYYHKILPYTHQDSILIIDDIYWSREMNDAWKYLASQDNVTVALDLYFMGILFFKNINAAKISEKLIPYRYKPFNIGLWG